MDSNSWRTENRKRNIETQRKARIKKRTALITILGNRCILCNRELDETNIIIHEIHGKPHPNSFEYISTHKEDFCIICRPHHAMIHRFKNDEKIDILIQLLITLKD